MVLMVDAQNIVSVFTVQRGNDRMQANKFSIRNEQHLGVPLVLDFGI